MHSVVDGMGKVTHVFVPVARRLAVFGFLCALVGVAGLSTNSASPAFATTQSSLSVYLDAPFVQGSYVSSGVVSQSFDSLPDGACPASIAVGSVTGQCTVEAFGWYGGAGVGATDATPTVGTQSGKYASTDATGMTITFPSDQSYLGLWWSAGSDGNTLKFFKDGTDLLTVTTDTIMDVLEPAPTDNANWVSLNTDANVVTAIDTTTKHRKMWYFGNPAGHTSATNPTGFSSTPNTQAQPFVYVHMFAGGNLTFDQVKLSGGGFEFDNLVASAVAQTPRNQLVQVGFPILSTQYAVRFDPNATGVDGTMSNQVGSAPAALTANTFTRSGFTFAGWNTSEDGRGTPYADGANYAFGADMTLYAQWTSNSGTGGGTSPVPVQPALAATGGTLTPLLLTVFGVATAFGVLLVAQSSRLRRR